MKIKALLFLNMSIIITGIMSSTEPSTIVFLAAKKNSGENSARLCQLMMTVCVDLFRDILDYYIKPAELQNEMRQNFNYFSTMTNKAQSAVLRSFLKTETGVFSSKSLDLSLLYIVIRSICYIPQPTNGWGTSPETDDRSLAANMERIRIDGIKIIDHSEEINETDFQDIWTSLRTNIEEIQQMVFKKDTYANAVDELFSFEFISTRYMDLFKRLKSKHFEFNV